MNVLEKILASKRVEIDALQRRLPPTPASSAPPRAPHSAVRALSRGEGAPLRLIAEVKFRSPSAGDLSTRLGPAERAIAYAASGATMVSVLTDAPFFAGSFEHLAAARAVLDRRGLSVPLLCKDFVLDESQIAAARASGADAVLLIARIVSSARLAELVREARARGVEPLVEIANEDELGAALATDARLVGVNARDLDTLEMDGERAARVAARIPGDRVAIHLSGVRTDDDVREIARGRCDAALVGEILMRQDDPGPLLASFARAALV